MRRVTLAPSLALAGVVIALAAVPAGAASGPAGGPAGGPASHPTGAARPAAAAAAGASAQAREHRRIIDYWTVDRVRRAVPRDFIRTSDGRFRLDPTADNGPVPAAKGGGKGGGGKGGGGGGGGKGGGSGDGSTDVLGASWTGGGTVLTSTGKVLFTMGGTDYICSGDVIQDDTTNDRSIVLTAAHCVYDQTTKAFATNWTFIPDYDSSPAPLTGDHSFCQYTSLGCWTANWLFAHDGFASQSSFDETATLYDWGFAVLGDGGKDDLLLEDKTKTQKIDFSGSDQVGTQVSAFGYPAQRPYTGDDLVYCRGPLTTDPYNDNQTLGLGCTMNGGSSGGPWFTGFDDGHGTGVQMSVNSYGYKGVRAIFGPRFNQDTEATYQAALTAKEDTVVAAQP